jgi:threonine dehydrogenase-like Zn-dependent dehydrogenase
MSLDVAEQIVATGTADMVCIVRSLIADPALVNKARGGNARLVRPCIGSNVGCIGRVKTAGRIGCVVNVAAGNEATIDFEPSRAPSAPKRVLIVGGGPAGLEAARTAAMRGHEVTLHEMRTHLGGQIAIAASAPHREGLAAITTWLGDEVARLGVRVERGSRVTAEMVAEFSADEVIIATGTQPTLSAPQVALPAAVVPGGQLPHVYTSWDVLGFGRDVSRATTALVFDDTGTFEAISVALALVRTGASVTFVSSLDMMGARVPLPVATVGHARAILQGSDFTFIPNSGIEAITAVEVMVRPLGTERTLVIPTELVAMVSAHHLNLELCDDLTNVGVAFHAVGDVNGAQDLQVALQQASATARNL